MDLVSLSTMRDRAKRAADLENSDFVSNTEWADYLNYGCRRLHDVLVSASGEEYWVKSYTFTIVAGTDTYALPADFYRERAFDFLTSPKPITMTRFQFRDRNKYNWAQFSWGAVGGAPLFCLIGPNVQFMPAPSGSTNGVKLWYIPTVQKTTDNGATWTSGALSLDTDKIDGINGYEELAVLEAAILARQKENTDASLLMARRAEILDWITTAAKRRNDGDPMFVGEAMPNESAFYPYGG
jgi:hypothetical protein